METMTPAHYWLSPSSSHRWIECPGSLHEPHPEDPGNPAATFGSMAHSWAEAWLSGRQPAQELLDYMQGVSANQRELMRDLVTFCVEYVFGLEYPEKKYETKIESDILDQHGGTVDVICVNDETLHIVDFKFGKVPVAAGGNPQLLCYLLLASQLYPGRTAFRATIVQPLYASVDTVEYTRADLDAFILRLLEASISTHRKAGDHCQYCPLLATCLTAAQFVRDCSEDFTDLTLEEDRTPTLEEREVTARAAMAYSIAAAGLAGARQRLKDWALKGIDLPYGFNLSRRNLLKAKEDAASRLLLRGFTEDQIYRLNTPAAIAKAAGVSYKAFKTEHSDLFDSVEVVAIGQGPDTPKDFSEFDDLTSDDSSLIIAE